MTKVQYLRDQAARAERLARGALDNLTIERLTAFSIEYRQMADLLIDAGDRIGGRTRHRQAPLIATDNTGP